MTVARRPRPSKASFMPQKRLKPLLASHSTSPMPGLGPRAPLAEGFKPARGTPALTLLCCSCRRDFGDTQGLALPFPSRERTLQSPPPGTKPVQPCPPPSALPSPHTTAPAEGTEVSSQQGQKSHPRGGRSVIPEGTEVLSQWLVAQFSPRWGLLCPGPPAHTL